MDTKSSILTDMKNLKYILTLFVATLLLSCSDDESDLNLENIGAPTNVGALFTIMQDNSGLVTIRPRGEGASKYEITLGDGTVEPVELGAGEIVDHVYAEGVYTVTIVATGITGKVTQAIQELTVSFRAPENLALTITPVAGNSFAIDVTATADYETYFEIWYGEDPNQAPVQFMEGETVTHTYANVGIYDVKVVAYSGGVATSEVTQQVTIANPFLLPITFDDPNLTYSFIDFGGAATTMIDNPDISGVNASAHVAQSVKGNGSEVWAGTAIQLDGVIDFSTLHHLRVKVWSPAAGHTVTLKLENATDATIFIEVTQTTTVANQWEYLTFDMSTGNLTQEYSKVILFYNLGQTGAGETFYFDDIRLTDGAYPTGFPLDFESATATYTFNGFGNATGEKVANPDVSGINTSANVGQVVKAAGAETWAGIHIPFTDPIDFSVLHKVKIKVWSPAAGITVLMKLENNGASLTTELPATTTVANAWEELEYDFTGIQNSNNYQNLVLFFDFNQVGTGATYYFDDVQLSN